jgi:hypothetical protein
VRIYADFNALIDPGCDDRHGLVDLHRMGTLRDLCAARLRLYDGLVLTLYSDSDEAEDLEIEARVRWMPSAVRTSGWVGEFDPAKFRHVTKTSAPGVFDWFPCSRCAADLSDQIRRAGLSLGQRCFKCGTLVHAPVTPPETGV